MYQDISNDTQSLYRLTQPGNFVFFAKNRSGSLTFSLEHADAHAHIFCIFEGSRSDTFHLETLQRHAVKNAESHLFVAGVLDDSSRLDYSGTIRIEKNATESVASLDNKNLLLGKSAFTRSEPKLEILNDIVICRHAAVTTPINAESLAYLRSRGISPKQAKNLLVQGFFSDLYARIDTLRV